MRRLLVPGLVLALLAGLFWWTRPSGDGPLHKDPSDVELCKQRLRAIFDGLVRYQAREGHAPRAHGNAFLGALIKSGIWDDSGASRERLMCPGPHAERVRWNSQDAAWSLEIGYLVTDFAAQGLGDFPAGGVALRALVTCRGAGGMSHDDALNVLYSDGSVKTLRPSRLRERGVLNAGSLRVPLGPGSPLPELALFPSE